MTNYTKFSDDALYRETRKRLGERPADKQAWDLAIPELRAIAAEIKARVDQRNIGDDR